MKIEKQNIDFYYINLLTRPDKKEKTINHLAQHQIEAKHFNALTGADQYLNIVGLNYNNGARGCMLSHIKLINEFDRSTNKILGVFEDDVLLCDDFNERLEYISQNFNKEWDIFFLSSFYHLNTDPIKDKPVMFEFTDVKYITRVYSSFCTHAYLINPNSIDKIRSLILNQVELSYAIDHVYVQIEQQLNCYAFTPGMANQRTDISDITNGLTDKTVFERILGTHYFCNRLENFDYDTFYSINK